MDITMDVITRENEVNVGDIYFLQQSKRNSNDLITRDWTGKVILPDYSCKSNLYCG